MNVKKTMTGSAIGAMSVMASAVAVIAATTVIHTSDLQGWGFAQETPTGSGAMVSGPGTPPLGEGSANLIVDSTGGEILAKADYLGVKLSDMTKLEYSTYRTSGGPALAIALQFNVDSDLEDGNTAYQGRLVYEPYHTQAVSTGVWQTWNALNDAAGTATGNWWFSNGTLATTSGCTMATPCTVAEVLTAYPNVGVHATLGAVIFKAGGGWTGGFDGNVDAFTIGVNGIEDTYDFEAVEPSPTPTVTPTPTATPTPTITLTPTPAVGPPTSMDQCKKDGWKTFNNPTFKNQGACVSYVQSNEKAGKRN